jgi:hypothetical protein
MHVPFVSLGANAFALRALRRYMRRRRAARRRPSHRRDRSRVSARACSARVLVVASVSVIDTKSIVLLERVLVFGFFCLSTIPGGGGIEDSADSVNFRAYKRH